MMASNLYGSLFGSWSVKVVYELDRCSKDAQDMLLTYHDRMNPGHAFLGTTNLDLGSLTERFQTRFQSVRLQPPENEVLAAHDQCRDRASESTVDGDFFMSIVVFVSFSGVTS